MPLNGSDVASKPAGTTAVANSTIESSPFNSVIDDIYSILNTVRSVAKGYTGASTEYGAVKSLKIGQYQTKSSGYTAVLADLGTIFRITATSTLSLTAAATLGASWWCIVMADGGDVTVDPDSSETINGSATLSIPDGYAALLVCNATAFFAATLSPSGQIDIPSSSGAAPTAQGRLEMDTDDNTVKVGDGAATKTLAYNDETHGEQTLFIPASAMIPAVTNGPSTGVVEEASNAHNYAVLDFDASTDEYACFEIPMPKSWDEGAIAFKAVWTTTATDTDGVAWGLQAVAVADGDDSDVAYGTAIVVTDDAQSNAGDVLITAESSALTVAGSPAAGELTQFRVFRDVSDANDDMTEDARLRGIIILYNTDASTDD